MSSIDLGRIEKYNKWLYSAHVYAEGNSNIHRELTSTVVSSFVDPLLIPKDAKILDLGCGPGYFLDEMANRDYTNLTGITLSVTDIAICENKGHSVYLGDLSFLSHGNASVDFIFLRHALEHSPYPIFSLIEYNRVLKQGGRIYVEVPSPECDMMHEANPNHYSILGEKQLKALMIRCGFSIENFSNLEFDLVISPSKPTMKEKYYCIVATKCYPLDIK